MCFIFINLWPCAAKLFLFYFRKVSSSGCSCMISIILLPQINYAWVICTTSVLFILLRYKVQLSFCVHVFDTLGIDLFMFLILW